MAVELKLTQKLLDGLLFERPIIGVNRTGPLGGTKPLWTAVG